MKKYQLSLTQNELEVLEGLTGMIAGSCQVRRTADGIWDRLESHKLGKVDAMVEGCICINEAYTFPEPQSTDLIQL